jgi:hypothetical protein
VSGGRRIPHAILVNKSQPLVRTPAEGYRFFPFHLRLSQRFSFQQITKQFRNEDYYFFFAVLPSRSTAAGWYIDFSGFSASRVSLTQDCFLNTTYVTADTTGTCKDAKTSDRG